MRIYLHQVMCSGDTRCITVSVGTSDSTFVSSTVSDKSARVELRRKSKLTCCKYKRHAVRSKSRGGGGVEAKAKREGNKGQGAGWVQVSEAVVWLALAVAEVGCCW